MVTVVGSFNFIIIDEFCVGAIPGDMRELEYMFKSKKFNHSMMQSALDQINVSNVFVPMGFLNQVF